MTSAMQTHMDRYQKCIEICNRCMVECEFCLDACLHEPDVDKRVECMELLKDCIEICSISAKYMAGNSKFAT